MKEVALFHVDSRVQARKVAGVEVPEVIHPRVKSWTAEEEPAAILA